LSCRAQAILALLRDEQRLAAEREAHARKRGTYQGFSSVDMAQASWAGLCWCGGKLARVW